MAHFLKTKLTLLLDNRKVAFGPPIECTGPERCRFSTWPDSYCQVHYLTSRCVLHSAERLYQSAKMKIREMTRN